MPAKEKIKKSKTVKRKVVRKTPKINLLRNMHVVLIVSGFLFSLLTIAILSAYNENNDIRTRGQVNPSAVPSTSVPSPSISMALPSIAVLPSNMNCLGGVCQPAQQPQTEPGRGNINNPNRQEEQQAPAEGQPVQNEEQNAVNPGQENEQEQGDANKGHGNDEAGFDADNPGKGGGGPNAEKQAAQEAEQNEGLIEAIQAFFAQLLQLLGINPQQQPVQQQ